MTQFSGFAPNYYFGQHNKGLSIYTSPGSINGVPFNGQVPVVSPQSITTLWVNSDGTLSNTNNLLTAPNDFTNAAWTFNLSSLIQANNQSDPIGSTNASLISFTNNSQTSVFQSVTPAGISLPNTTFTFSIWLRASSGSPTIKLIIDDQSTLIQQNIVSLSTSWNFFQITGTMGIGSTAIKSVFGAPNDTNQNYFVYAPQLVLGSTLNINSNPYPFGIVISGIIDTGGNIVNPNILDDGILSITDIRIR